MADNKKKANIVDMQDLQIVIKIFSKNWYVLLICIALGALISYFYTYKLPDVYAAKNQILLKSDDTYDYQNQIYKGIGYYQPYQDNDNQIRVITSNDLIAEALSHLKFDVSYFIVGRVKTKEVYESMPFDFEVKQLNSGLYEQNIKFKIVDQNRYSIEYMKHDQQVKKVLPFNQQIVEPDFIWTVKKNEYVNASAISNLRETDYLIQVHSQENLVSKFKNALNVQTVDNTTILELTLEDQIPNRAITFLDTLSKVYVDYTAKSEYTINENTLDNIDKQLKEVTYIFDSLQDELEDYKSNKAILDLDKQEADYFDKLMEYDKDKRDLELYVQSLNALEEYIVTLAEKVDKKLLPPSFYIEEGDDYMKEALSKIYSMQMERNEKLFGSTERNRGVGELDQNIESLRKNLLTYIANSKRGLAIRIADVQRQIDDYTGIIKRIPKTQRDLLTIQRKVDVNEDMYKFLLEKRASTIIARSGILPQTSVIETAHSVGIVHPNKRKILYYFIIVAAIIGLVIAFMRSVLLATIENINELKRLTNLPVLGEIIYTPEASEGYIIVDKDPKAAVTESFRAIRTNLEYMASDSSSKVILITSYNPGEGKTFCSVNLATILAKAGKGVLLLELDLHKPKIQKAMNMTSEVGVSTILIGKTPVAEAILPTPIENLSVILSGPTPPNASEIILSRNLNEIFDYAKANFDYVIVDTPPVGLITDALVIMKSANISLFVLNAKYAKKHIVDVAEEIVSANKVKNFGFILNGVKRKRSKYYYNYGYGGYGGYGYGYGYGYGNNKNVEKKDTKK